jgi:hypothetical protein
LRQWGYSDSIRLASPMMPVMLDMTFIPGC